MSAWSWRPAEKAADAVSTSCPPMEIQPVNQEATALVWDGARQATQWYCPEHMC